MRKSAHWPAVAHFWGFRPAQDLWLRLKGCLFACRAVASESSCLRVPCLPLLTCSPDTWPRLKALLPQGRLLWSRAKHQLGCLCPLDKPTPYLPLWRMP